MKKIKSQDEFEVLRKLNKDTQPSQRELAKQLGFSLGKLNYCLRALKDKGLVKIKNFQNQKEKVKYFQSYILTPKGITERTKLTLNFMKKKFEEYEKLKKELEENNVDDNKI